MNWGPRALRIRDPPDFDIDPKRRDENKEWERWEEMKPLIPLFPQSGAGALQCNPCWRDGEFIMQSNKCSIPTPKLAWFLTSFCLTSSQAIILCHWGLQSCSRIDPSLTGLAGQRRQQRATLSLYGLALIWSREACLCNGLQQRSWLIRERLHW